MSSLSSLAVSSSDAIGAGNTWNGVTKDINSINHSKIKFKWAHKQDTMRHTFIVIQFDHTQKYTLDFGGRLEGVSQTAQAGSLWVSDQLADRESTVSKLVKETTRKMAASLNMTGVVSLRPYSGGNFCIKGKLAELSIKSPREKEFAKQVWRTIKGLDIKDYNLKENNCRTYVLMVVGVFIQKNIMSIQQQREFRHEMGKLLKEDEKVFLEFVQSDRPLEDFVDKN